MVVDRGVDNCTVESRLDCFYFVEDLKGERIFLVRRKILIGGVAIMVVVADLVEASEFGGEAVLPDEVVEACNYQEF